MEFATLLNAMNQASGFELYRLRPGTRSPPIHHSSRSFDRTGRKTSCIPLKALLFN